MEDEPLIKNLQGNKTEGSHTNPTLSAPCTDVYSNPFFNKVPRKRGRRRKSDKNELTAPDARERAKPRRGPLIIPTECKPKKEELVVRVANFRHLTYIFYKLRTRYCFSNWKKGN